MNSMPRVSQSCFQSLVSNRHNQSQYFRDMIMRRLLFGPYEIWHFLTKKKFNNLITSLVRSLAVVSMHCDLYFTE